MTWPWSRSESRSAASNSYSGLVLAGLLAEATGGRSAAVSSTSGAVQSAAALWARCLGACRSDVPGVDAGLLSAIGYDLGTKGESLFVLDVDPITGSLRMLRAGGWTVYGNDPNPATWRYLATIPAPSGSVTRQVPAGGAAHFTYLPNARLPWTADAPWERAPMLASLAVEVEAALRDEARQPVQALIPAPTGMTDDEKAAYRARVLDRRQGATFVETQMQAFGTGRGAAPQADYSHQAIPPGPDARARFAVQGRSGAGGRAVRDSRCDDDRDRIGNHRPGSLPAFHRDRDCTARADGRRGPDGRARATRRA